MCVCTFQPYSFLPEDYFPDNLTLSSIYLSLQYGPKNSDIKSAKGKTKAGTHGEESISVLTHCI